MYTIKHTFFCASISEKYLSEEESNHAIRVLRLKEGDIITVINGEGRKSIGEITIANKKKLHFSIKEDFTAQKSAKNIHIAIAPTKSMDRLQFFIEKVIEIGIDKISLVQTKNSERKNVNINKIRKNAISALKQSGNLFLPIIDDIQPFNNFITAQFNQNQLFIAHCENDLEKKEFKNLINSKKNIVILIGPEGDFTAEEIILAKQNNFIPVSLGDTRLRTETAGIVACHTVHII